MVSVTLREVAERAGISLATASKVMNERGDVKEQTRQAVREAAHELGYTHRRRASNGRPSVVIVFDSLSSPYALQVLQGASRAASRAGADLVVATADDQDEGRTPLLSRAWFRATADRGHAAVISVTMPLDSRHMRHSRACSLPLLVIDPATVDSSLTGSDGPVRISATNWAGGRAATEHLLGLGHRRIGVIAGPADSVPGRERTEGYRSALEQAGIGYVPELVGGGRYDFETGRAEGRRLLAMTDPPTAVFATSDTLALGALRAAHEAGVRVPEELSVIGFDDTQLAQWSSPQLTVIQQPLAPMGQVAVERALALAADPRRFSHPFQLETHLVVRESTGPCPSRVRADAVP